MSTRPGEREHEHERADRGSDPDTDATQTAAAAVLEVHESEHAMIAVARALVGGDPGPATAVLAAAWHGVPRTIGPACAELIGDALRRVWPALWRRGGAPAVAARPWEAEPMALRFGAPTLELLRWLVMTPLGSAPGGARSLPAGGGAAGPSARPPALGDQVAVYLALALAVSASGEAAARTLAAQPLAQAAPLAWLGFAHLFGDAAPPPPAAFDELARARPLVTALAPELARRWRAVEVDKRGATDARALIALGAAQDAALEAWLGACDRVGARELAGFVLDAAAPLLAAGRAPEPGGFDEREPLSVRAGARVAAGALLRGVTRWAGWDREHRGVRFFDDGYAHAQQLLARFEVVGPVGAERAATWLAQLSALPGGAPVPGPATGATVAP